MDRYKDRHGSRRTGRQIDGQEQGWTDRQIRQDRQVTGEIDGRTDRQTAIKSGERLHCNTSMSVARVARGCCEIVFVFENKAVGKNATRGLKTCYEQFFSGGNVDAAERKLRFFAIQ